MGQQHVTIRPSNVEAGADLARTVRHVGADRDCEVNVHAAASGQDVWRVR